jgi:hypothetical protein
VETVLSVATLAGLIWVVRVLLPRALEQDDRFALFCAALAALLSLALWFLFGPVPMA